MLMCEYNSKVFLVQPNVTTPNTGDMGSYCLKPNPVYFNAFPMWQQVLGPVQYINKFIHLIKENIMSLLD